MEGLEAGSLEERMAHGGSHQFWSGRRPSPRAAHEMLAVHLHIPLIHSFHLVAIAQLPLR